MRSSAIEKEADKSVNLNIFKNLKHISKELSNRFSFAKEWKYVF